jgi:hypothetical protein
MKRDLYTFGKEIKMDKTIFICGNGNISFEKFYDFYINKLKLHIDINNSFIVGDFRGTDTLILEYLKTLTPNVEVCHLFERPRYLPDKFNTYVSDWKITGGFKTNAERDLYMINKCTHFLAYDQNSDMNRKSGTLKNIETCKRLNKYEL